MGAGDLSRSGLGFKHRIGLDNTVGIIDADYYGSSNEGHIMIKMSCTAHDAGHSATVAAGDGFAQGIFLPFGITEDDAADGVRDGGFGLPQRNKSRTNGRVPTHAACIFAKEKGLRSSNLKPFFVCFLLALVNGVGVVLLDSRPYFSSKPGLM